MFSHTKFEIALNICHITFLWWVQIDPHLSRLTNVENLSGNFCQFVQTFFSEEQREENSICKALCVMRKLSNKWYVSFNHNISMMNRSNKSVSWNDKLDLEV